MAFSCKFHSGRCFVGSGEFHRRTGSSTPQLQQSRSLVLDYFRYFYRTCCQILRHSVSIYTQQQELPHTQNTHTHSIHNNKKGAPVFLPTTNTLCSTIRHVLIFHVGVAKKIFWHGFIHVLGTWSYTSLVFEGLGAYAFYWSEMKVHMCTLVCILWLLNQAMIYLTIRSSYFGDV